MLPDDHPIMRVAVPPSEDDDVKKCSMHHQGGDVVDMPNGCPILLEGERMHR